MFRYVPDFISAGLTWYDTENASVVSPKFQPALNAAMFASRICGFFANFAARNDSVASVGRLYSQDTSPRANMFFDRDACLRLSRNSLTASVVSVVRVNA